METEKKVEPIIIAHISDLHFNDTDEWHKRFEHMKELLISKNPHAVIITGDLLDKPKKKYFVAIKEKVDALISGISDCHFVVIPGNHDIHGTALVGNKIGYTPKWLINKRKNKIAQLNYPYDKKEQNKAIKELYNKHKVAVFPLMDSGGSFFAKGYIENLASEITNLKKMFLEMHGDVIYNDCYKIAALHHHIFPFPRKYDDTSYKFWELRKKLESKFLPLEEPFMLLMNSHDLLAECNSNNINIILHGHKHLSSMIKFHNIKKENGLQYNPIYVSACASSCKRDEDYLEAKLMYLNNNFISKVEVYTSNGSRKFTLKPDDTNDDFYGDIRKEKNKKCFPESSIKKLRYKKKFVNIAPDGSACVTVSYNDIKWNEGTEKAITERFRADTGRIRGGFASFKISNNINNAEEKKDLDSVDSQADPDTIELYEYKFEQHKNSSVDDKVNFELQYPLLNAFTFTEVDHEESYRDWPSNLIRSETCSIDSTYPAYFLHLIVKFPGEYCFPENPPYLNVYEREALEIERINDIQKNQLRKDIIEENFLKDKHAIMVHEEINTIEMIIKYPQPNKVYSLRWDVKNNSYKKEKLYEEYFTQVSKLRNNITKNKGSEKINDFYNNIKKYLESKEFVSASETVFLLGYDQTDKLLKVVRPNTVEHNGKGLLIGRGPAGMAFKSKNVYFGESSTEIFKNIKSFRDAQVLRPVYLIEPLVKGYDNMLAAISLPIIIPNRSNSTEWKKILNKEIPPFVIGVISIGTSNKNSFIYKLTKEPAKLFVESLKECFANEELAKTSSVINVFINNNKESINEKSIDKYCSKIIDIYNQDCEKANTRNDIILAIRAFRSEIVDSFAALINKGVYEYLA